MAQISRLRQAEIANGNLINADDLNAEFDQLLTESNSQDTRLNTIESQNMTLSGTKTFNSAPKMDQILEKTTNAGVTADGVRLKDGTVKAVIATDPTSPEDGELWYNSTDAAFKFRMGGSSKQFLTAEGLKYFVSGGKPRYSSASSISVDPFSVVNSVGDRFLKKDTSTTVNITNAGLNGVAQSANLTGTVSVSSGSSTVTGSGTSFSTQFQVGDVIAVTGSESRRITTISSNTALTVASNFSTTASGATYKRGGEAPSTWYHLYAIGDNTTPGLILSTRNLAGGDTLVDLPSGYTHWRQLPFSLRNDGAGDVLPFYVGGWPHNPWVYYDVTYSFYDYHVSASIQTGTTNVIANSSVSNYATWTAQSLSAFVPVTARLAKLRGLSNSAAGWNIRPTGSSHNGQQAGTQNGFSEQFYWDAIRTDSNQSVDVCRSDNTAGKLWLDVMGFQVTEVV
ncbi:MAG: hypothetical protein SFZ03_04820 [Candidatus Melainabacteria bacterium]|nr:hypothetical protein [Candidatus Melainabacteria bacterium]